MTNLRQKAAWCEERTQAEVPKSGKCPECGAALRIRAGHDYCWFCEKEVDLSCPPVPVTTKPSEEKIVPKTRGAPPAPSRSEPPLAADPPAELNIVFDDEDDGIMEVEFEEDDIVDPSPLPDEVPSPRRSTPDPASDTVEEDFVLDESDIEKESDGIESMMDKEGNAHLGAPPSPKEAVGASDDPDGPFDDGTEFIIDEEEATPGSMQNASVERKRSQV